MFKSDRPAKNALQPALNKVNVKEQFKSLAANHAANNQLDSLKQRLVTVTDKLGDVVTTRNVAANSKLSENYDDIKCLELKEPSPPRLRQNTRTTRNTLRQQLELQQHQLQLQQNLKSTESHDQNQASDILIAGAKQQLNSQLKSSLENQDDVLKPNQLSDSNQPPPPSSATLLSSVVSRIPRLSIRAPSQINFLASRNFQTIDEKNGCEASRTKSGNRALQPMQVDCNEGDNDVVEDVDMMIDDEDIEDIDKSTSRDALFLVCDYVKDIYVYLRKLEDAQFIRENYLKDQKILTPKIRQRLINWCIDFHQQFRLLPETLYLTIATMDRYFQDFTVTQQNQVQLVALGATLIASKYEEIYPPDVSDLASLTANAYSKREILRTEINILKQLEFNLGRPIPLSFLRRFSKAANCDVRMHSISKYLMELSLTEYDCAHWAPSQLAAAALYVTLHLTRAPGNAIKVLGDNNSCWDKTITHYTQYTRKQLIVPAATLCKILKRAQRSPSSFNCVKKISSSLSDWSELHSSRVDQIIRMGDSACKTSSNSAKRLMHL